MLSFLKKNLGAVSITIALASALTYYSFTEDYYFEVSKNLDIFTTLFRNVNTYYVDSVQPGEMMRNGIDAMLSKLDPYTVYIPEAEVEDYKMTHISAEYGGIGATVHKRGDYIQISELYEGFPAQKSGLKVGDKLVTVDGNNTKGRSVDDVSSFMRGQKGSTVKIAVLRDGSDKPLEFSVVRDEIKFKNVRYFGMVGPHTGYIKLVQFLENSGEEVKEALAELKKNPELKNVVLDLRGNGGGLLKESVEIVNLFIEKNQKIVEQKGKLKELNISYIATKEPLDKDIPLAVLVDKGSASASEIVTGSLQELDRAIVIGQRSFGKGLVQQTYNISYNALLKVTIAKYYTPSGRCIQALDYTHRNIDGSVDKFSDSLITEFKTKNGRSVYDGSGVFPDIYIEKQPMANVSFALGRNYLFYDYAEKYVKSHPSIAPAKEFMITDADYNDFLSFISDKKYEYENRSEDELEALKEAAEKDRNFDLMKAEYESLKKKIAEAKKSDVSSHKEEIKKLLEMEIASRYYYEKGRMEVSFEYDAELKKAMETLNNTELYKNILNGAGEYKVIGKPGSAAQLISRKDREEE